MWRVEFFKIGRRGPHAGKRRRAPKLAEFSYITVSLRANGAAIAAVLVSKTTIKSFAEKIPVATLP